MTPHSFFTILIKIMGAWLLVSSLTVLPQYVSSIYSTYTNLNSPFSNDSSGSIFPMIAVLTISLAVYVILFYVLLFKSGRIISILNLDKGFNEERFELNIHRSTVITIAVIVTGAVLIMESIPSFIRQLFAYIQTVNMPDPPSEYNYGGWVIFYLIQALIGYLLITRNKWVTNFIEQKRRTTS